VKRELPRPPAYEFGRCLCGGSYELRLVEVAFHDRDVVLTEVPQGHCPGCGSRIFKAGVLDCLDRLHSGRELAAEPHPLEGGVP
jgi:YgiT-type zinc finger domain-containing protein